MKQLIMLAAVCMLFHTEALPQSTNEPAALSETMYLLAKPGMNKEFEEGVAKHNAKYHAPGKDNQAMLRRVEYGNKAGWYVWVMTGSYSSLDSRPDDEGHSKDWEENVGKYVEEYGDTDLWSLNRKLSYGLDKFQSQKRYEAWALDLKPWQGYRFNEAMTKLKAAFEKMGNRTMLVFDSEVNRKGGPDRGIVWGYDNFADLETDSKLVETYKSLYGENSWDNFLEEWKAVVVEVDQEHRIKID
ncbi:hypothetical protein OO013_16680 [Mangrovivirga sp. M17]|uniref:Uncharacterized protein n=1 Tax=Mangrovivirga halotolerans TaxID=2993936 RepID=A0ABT3RV54_9BACT|nr:hypothetical protein [Mangrovivirga halotolerans]MCX2745518.1 hypothetical protein [Mangrovivirga halotolerans]